MIKTFENFTNSASNNCVVVRLRKELMASFECTIDGEDCQVDFADMDDPVYVFNNKKDAENFVSEVMAHVNYEFPDEFFKIETPSEPDVEDLINRLKENII